MGYNQSSRPCEDEKNYHQYPAPQCAAASTFLMVFEWGIGVVRKAQSLRNIGSGTVTAVTGFGATYTNIYLNGVAQTLPFYFQPYEYIEVEATADDPGIPGQVFVTGDVAAWGTLDAIAGNWCNYPLLELQNAYVDEEAYHKGRFSLTANTGTTNYDVGAYSDVSFTGKGSITFNAVGRECFYGISRTKSYPGSNIYFRHEYSCYIYPSGLDTYELGSGGGASSYGQSPGGVTLTSRSQIEIEVTDAGGGAVNYYHNGVLFRTVAIAFNPNDVWYADLSGRYNLEQHSPVLLTQDP